MARAEEGNAICRPPKSVRPRLRLRGFLAGLPRAFRGGGGLGVGEGSRVQGEGGHPGAGGEAEGEAGETGRLGWQGVGAWEQLGGARRNAK